MPIPVFPFFKGCVHALTGRFGYRPDHQPEGSLRAEHMAGSTQAVFFGTKQPFATSAFDRVEKPVVLVFGERSGYQIGTQPNNIPGDLGSLYENVANPVGTTRYKVNALIPRRFDSAQKTHGYTGKVGCMFALAARSCVTMRTT